MARVCHTTQGGLSSATPTAVRSSSMLARGSHGLRSDIAVPGRGNVALGASGKDNFFPNWLRTAPRIKVRSTEDRSKLQLADLAVLNARLEGGAHWEARQKLEYLQKSRETWEAVYQDLLTSGGFATLESIEETKRKIDLTLSEEFRESNSVTEMRSQLQQLQQELDEAHQQLGKAKAVVSRNESDMAQLQQEAEKLRRLSESPGSSAVVLPSATRTQLHKEPSPVPSPEETMKADGLRKKNFLRSSLDIEEELKDHWFPVDFSSSLKPDMMVPFDLFGNSFVLFRDETGAPSCVMDECAHRACPLSLGTVNDGQISCAYHGWRFNRSGECTEMPSTQFCKGVQVHALNTAEKDGMIWVWAGEVEPFRPIPDIGDTPDGHTVHSEIVMEVPVEHGLLVENLLDLAHAPFTHTSTFARGWPVPEAVKVRMVSILSGEWDPYPIDMSFEPPCMTLSLIGLQKPGQVARGARAEDCEKHLRQMHVCLPARPGHTRLLYRMSLDFLPFLKHVPFIDRVWKEMANRVMGEDLVLVQGQQKRMSLGGDTWANPVSYDKMGVRYRRWRNSLSSDDVNEKRAASDALRSGSMSAGELFSVDEDASP